MPIEKPLVVAVEMGYGHLRPAESLANALGTSVLEADCTPLADAQEQRLWKHARSLYELTSRVSQIPVVGAPIRSALEAFTFIPHLHPYRDLSRPTIPVRVLERLTRRGLGGGLVAKLMETGVPLLTTFFAPAVIADRCGCQHIYCVVTDSDIARIWAPMDPLRGRIHYFVPSHRALRRMKAYGVRPEQVQLTGFPLPEELLGGPGLTRLRQNLAARLVRLDRSCAFRKAYRDELAKLLEGTPLPTIAQAPLLTFAVGGAGAQASLARDFLPGMRSNLEAGRLRLALVAGVRADVEARFRDAVFAAGLEPLLGSALQIFRAQTFGEYYRGFNALLADTDILWTKPSELTFYAALGLPLVFSWPMGVHERYNRRWAMESGAGLKQGDPRFASQWIDEWLNDGTLAAAAWSGFMRLPKFGLYQILQKFGHALDEAPSSAVSRASP